MGYALNLCKFHIYNVPYNHNIVEEGMKMTQNKEANLRSKAAIKCLEAMRDGAEYKTEIVLPVDLIKRESTRKL